MSRFYHLGDYPAQMAFEDGMTPAGNGGLFSFPTIEEFVKWYWRLRTMSIGIEATAFGGFEFSAGATAERWSSLLQDIVTDEAQLTYPGADSETDLWFKWTFTFDQIWGDTGGTFTGTIVFSVNVTSDDDIVSPSWWKGDDGVTVNVKIEGSGGGTSPGIEYRWTMTNGELENPIHIVDPSPVKFISGNPTGHNLRTVWNDFDGNPGGPGIFDFETLHVTFYFNEGFLYDGIWNPEFESDELPLGTAQLL